MVESVQSFVEKIRVEGLHAGQREADQLIVQARSQADEIVAQAHQQKDAILAEAKREADDAFERSQTELQLAARDAVLRLRGALNGALRAVLSHGAKEHLTDLAFLGNVLHEIVTSYAQADRDHVGQIKINVPTEMRQELVEWAIGEIGRETADGTRESIDLKSTLQEAGFEYEVNNAIVEVTLDSVVETLAALVGPRLREIIDQAMADGRN